MLKGNSKLMCLIKRKIQTAVVTGPTGSIGQALCRLLLSKGIKVYAVCKPKSHRAKTLPNHMGMHIISCDIKDMEKLPEKLNTSRADAFFHFAWVGNDGDNRNSMELQTDNIRYAIDACNAAHQLGCKIFIGAGSQAEYGRTNMVLSPNTPCFPENGYGMAKLCAGQMTRAVCHKIGIEHIWPRFLSVYGPYEQTTSMTISTIIKLLKGEIPKLTAGEQLWDYLYTNDAADGLYRMMISGRDGAVYTIGGGHSQPLRKFVEILRDAIDPEIPIDFGAVPYADNQIMFLKVDNSAITADTGFIPHTNFKDGIKETVEWVRGIMQ